MKVAMTEAVCKEGLALLDGVADVFVADNANVGEYVDKLQDCDGLIVRAAPKGVVSKAVVDACPNLRVVGRTGVGFDSVDVDACTAAGIPVIVTPGANNHSVAEHSLALMFALSKNMVEAHNETLKGNAKAIRGKGVAFELYGKTVGILGMGAIGRDTAALCKAVGMKVIGYDPFLPAERILMSADEAVTDYREMLPKVDFISIHVPLTKETEGMISMPELKTMKPTAMIINCARGGIVNEADLCQALNEGIIGGAGIDVFVEEYPSVDNPLPHAKNMIASPHSAAQTKEAVINMATMCVNGCLAVLRGEKWPFVADKKVYDHPRWAGAKDAQI